MRNLKCINTFVLSATLQGRYMIKILIQKWRFIRIKYPAQNKELQSRRSWNSNSAQPDTKAQALNHHVTESYVLPESSLQYGELCITQSKVKKKKLTTGNLSAQFTMHTESIC